MKCLLLKFVSNFLVTQEDISALLVTLFPCLILDFRVVMSQIVLLSPSMNQKL